MSDLINWFEIPVNDFDRAETFYNGLFEIELERTVLNDATYGNFPRTSRSRNQVGGAIVKGGQNNPSSTGTIVYFDVTGEMEAVLNRAERLGGKIEVNRTLIDVNRGYFALIHDSEGNRVGLFSEE
ncbi:MAG: VOC family protein [Bacteroidia bacterium]